MEHAVRPRVKGVFARVTVAPTIQNCSKHLCHVRVVYASTVPKYRVISRTPFGPPQACEVRCWRQKIGPKKQLQPGLF